ncbi:hypothetical protein V8G54_010706 [Vigna mungo]|uniref:Uncharacterized protein n=1 Tax=Vigna mungo TaxID=3915 RepID=A0AAQ3S3D1_VIGMU
MSVVEFEEDGRNPMQEENDVDNAGDVVGLGRCDDERHRYEQQQRAMPRVGGVSLPCVKESKPKEEGREGRRHFQCWCCRQRRAWLARRSGVYPIRASPQISFCLNLLHWRSTLVSSILHCFSGVLHCVFSVHRARESAKDFLLTARRKDVRSVKINWSRDMVKFKLRPSLNSPPSRHSFFSFSPSIVFVTRARALASRCWHSGGGLGNQQFLKVLVYLQSGYGVYSCEGLLPLSLTNLEIYDFLNLKKLDCNTLSHLSSLEKLDLLSCLSLQCLVEEGLPKTISELPIKNCPLLKQHFLLAELARREKEAGIFPEAYDNQAHLKA